MGIFQRGLRYFRHYGVRNGVRKFCFLLVRIQRICIQSIRRFRFFFYTNCWVDSILGKVYLYGIGNNVSIGKDATLYPGGVWEIGENAQVRIGDHFTLSYGALIASHHALTIGNNVMIGEYTSLRDTTHSFEDTSLPYGRQTDRSLGISIGNNVWIGRGCIILPGTVIEDGVVVGANFVVKGHLLAYGLFAGSPARLLKKVRETKEKMEAVPLYSNHMKGHNQPDVSYQYNQGE